MSSAAYYPKNHFDQFKAVEVAFTDLASIVKYILVLTACCCYLVVLIARLLAVGLLTGAAQERHR
jgi:hypothetical protein